MSRRRASRPPRPARRNRARWAWRWLTFPLVAIVLLGYVLMRLVPRPRRHPPSAQPAERLGAEDAYRTGLSLGNRGHHLAALPYFANAVRQAPDSWTARQSYASALYNGALETRLHLGKAEPTTRSSVERITLVRASMVESRAADSVAASPRDRAFIAYQRAQMFATFGLLENALVEFRRADALDPNPGLVAAIHLVERSLASGGQRE